MQWNHTLASTAPDWAPPFYTLVTDPTSDATRKGGAHATPDCRTERGAEEKRIEDAEEGIGTLRSSTRDPLVEIPSGWPSLLLMVPGKKSVLPSFKRLIRVLDL
ncbi:hypothetical protein OPV22_006161 [Ensete ventricosum]|uniref:Uncharacterized protein n=1 Tax=Ensete ventricosum TaxID=4639 RepID=A0AAV8RSU1_ENSVE|nr:hypothetical protein OPV22_006161 [Ensete ventricosum]